MKTVNYSIQRYLDYDFKEFISKHTVDETLEKLEEILIGIEPNPLSSIYYTDWEYETEQERGKELLKNYLNTRDNNVLDDLQDYVLSANYFNLGDELPLPVFANLLIETKKGV